MINENKHNQERWVYLAPDGFINELTEELKTVGEVNGQLLFSTVKNPQMTFAQDIWISPTIFSFQSISEAARLLRQKGKYWFHYPSTCIRRGTLIAEQLAKLPLLAVNFPPQNTLPHIGCFTLLDQNTLLIAEERTRKMPAGIYHFVEDKTNPPNRAYLKLWEAFCILEKFPQPGEIALDLGASPGGWSYVLQSFQAKTIAVDKAPLDPKISCSPYIEYQQKSAFSLEPRDFDHIDWLCSDIACYPERLYTLITKWLQSGKVNHMICTIKLQGKTDFQMIHDFQQIPNSQVLHLYHNKHELTFLHQAATLPPSSVLQES